MPVQILMPALSPTMTEGTLAKWLKSEGDNIAAGDVIAEIETDKATMEVEAVDEGMLGRILVKEGTENVPVNQPIGLLLEDGEDASALDSADAAAPAPEPKVQSEETEKPAAASRPVSSGKEVAATPLARRIAEEAELDISAIAGTGAHGKVTRADVVAARDGDGGLKPAAASVAEQPQGDRIFASPLARRVAAEAGLDIGSIPGSGPNGRIVMADVEAAKADPSIMKAAAGAPAPAGGSELVRMSAMRKVIAERMASSKSNVPHFYLTVDCEIDELLKMRSVMNERLEAEGVKLSVNDFIIKACALALMEVPDANASFEGDGNIRKYHSADISIAVALDGGLITPIVRNADSKSLAEISNEMKELAGKARDGKLAPEEYQGGSFSISNLGMYGIKQFDAIINEPQGAILAVGAGEQRPVVKNGELAVATVMSCTISCDHRVVDGALGAVLLSAIKRFIEYPPLLLM